MKQGAEISKPKAYNYYSVLQGGDKPRPSIHLALVMHAFKEINPRPIPVRQEPLWTDSTKQAKL